MDETIVLWQSRRSTRSLKIALSIVAALFLPLWIEALRLSLSTGQDLALFGVWQVNNLSPLGQVVTALISLIALIASLVVIWLVWQRGFRFQVVLGPTTVQVRYDGRNKTTRQYNLAEIIDLEYDKGPVGISLIALLAGTGPLARHRRRLLATFDYTNSSQLETAAQQLRQAMPAARQTKSESDHGQ